MPIAIGSLFMHNRSVHLPGEHPVTRGEDLWPQGDGVGDVALNFFVSLAFPTFDADRDMLFGLMRALSNCFAEPSAKASLDLRRCDPAAFSA